MSDALPVNSSTPYGIKGLELTERVMATSSPKKIFSLTENKSAQRHMASIDFLI